MLLPSCATIFTKSKYPLTIESEPGGADVKITNKRGLLYATGETPMVVELKSGDGFLSRAEYYVELVKAGYKPVTVPVTFKIEGWYFANILLGGIIGMVIVDPATGAMWKLQADYLKVDLTNPDSPASISIISLDDAYEDMEKAMVPIE